MAWDQKKQWDRAIYGLRVNPVLREHLIQSVVDSFALSGIVVDREAAMRALEDALSGAPLIYPGGPA